MLEKPRKGLYWATAHPILLPPQMPPPANTVSALEHRCRAITPSNTDGKHEIRGSRGELSQLQAHFSNKSVVLMEMQ